MRITSILGLSLMISSAAMAQQNDAQKLESVQITASAPVKQVTKNTVVQLHSEIPVSLQTQTSVIAQSDAGSGFGYTYLRVRGMDQTRLSANLNGLPLSDPEDQGFYPSNLPNLISSTTITLTPGSTGSGGGVAGTAGQLDINTLNPFSLKRNASTTFGYGSFGTLQASMNLSSGHRGSTAGWLNATAQKSDGFRLGAYEEGTSFIGSASKLFSSFIVTTTGLYGNVRHGSAWVPIPLSVAKVNPRTNDLNGLGEHFKQGIAQIQVDGSLTDRDRVSATIMSNWLNGTFDIPSTNTLSYGLNQRWLQGALTWVRSFNDNSISSGILISNDSRIHYMTLKDSSDQFYNNTGNKKEQTVWTRGSFNVVGFTVIPELQVRRIEFSYIPSVTGGTFDTKNWVFVNPKITINKSLSSNVTTYVNGAITNREPTRSDLFAGADDLDPSLSSDLRSNPVIPERMRSFEAGIKYRTTTRFVSLNAFTMNFRNEISPNGPMSSLGLPLRQNVPVSYRRGLELEASQYLPTKTTVSLSGSLIDASIAFWNDKTTNETVLNATPLQTPPYTIHARVVQSLGNVKVSVIRSERGAIFLSNTEDPVNRLPAVSWLTTSVELPIGKANARLSMENLGNKFVPTGGWAGPEPMIYVMARRNFNVQVTLPLR